MGGRFIYPGGDLNLNGDSCHGGGPKLRSPWVQKAYNSYRMFFFNYKYRKFPVRGKFWCRVIENMVCKV